MMGHREKGKGHDEHDVFSGWRRVLVYMGRAGVTHRAKARFARRTRRKTRQETMALAVSGHPGIPQKEL